MPKLLLGCVAIALVILAIVTLVRIWALKQAEGNITVGWKGDQVYIFNNSLAPILITHLTTSTSGRAAAELPKPVLMPSHSDVEIPTVGLRWEFTPYGQQENSPKQNTPIFIVYRRMSVIGP